MPTVKWVIDGSQAERDDCLFDLLVREIHPKSQVPNFWILTVSKRRNRLLQQAWQSRFQKGGWRLPTFIFLEWVEFLYGHCNPKLKNESITRLISDAEAYVVIENALLQLRKQLNYFNRIFKSPEDLSFLPGLIGGIKGFISFLKDNGIRNNLVERLSVSESGDSSDRDHDLTLLFHQYEQMLISMNLRDRQDQCFKLLDASATDFEPSFFPDTLVIDHPTFFSVLEERVLGRFLSSFKNIIVAVDSKKNPSNLLAELTADASHPYNGTKDFFAHLISIAAAPIEEIRAGQVKSKIAVPPLIHSHHQRIQEVQWICREIKMLSLEKKADLGKIQVAFPDIQSYLSIIYEIFPQYGIPFSVTRGLSLNSSPLAIVVRSILKIPERFARENIFRFFSSSLVTFRQRFTDSHFVEFIQTSQIGALSSVMNESEIIVRYQAFCEEQKARGIDGFHFDVSSLDRYARSANIVGGTDLINDWFIPLDRVYFRARIGAEDVSEDEVEDIKRRYFLILRQLYLLNVARKHFQQFRMAKTGAEVLECLKNYIGFFEIEKNLVRRLENLPLLAQRDRHFLLRRDMQALELILDILEEVKKAIVLQEQLSEDNSESPLAFVERHINRLIEQTTIVDPHEDHRVQITESLELRNISFDVLFFGGLSSTDFPRRKRKEFLLPDELNIRFRQVDATVESRYLFESIIKNTFQRLYLSFPRMESGYEGEKVLEPSMLLEDLSQDLDIPIVPASENSRLILSKNDLESALASHIPIGEPLTNPDFAVLFPHVAQPDRVRQMANIELQRLSNQRLSAYDGIVGTMSGFLSPSEQSIFVPSILSDSILSQFAQCPQRFLYQRLLHLEPLDEITEEVERDTLGNYVHKILEDFIAAWIEQKKEGPIDEVNFLDALKLMNTIGTKVLAQQGKAVEYVLWDYKKERILNGLQALETTGQPGVLRKFLEFEKIKTRNGFSPKSAEKRFGYEERVYLGPTQVRGKIDRIDESTQNAPFPTKTHLVLDYKTGRIPTRVDMLSGLSFQIPLYLAALKQISPSPAVVGAYLSLHEMNDVTLTQMMGTIGVAQQEQMAKDIETEPKKPTEMKPWMDFLFSDYAEKIKQNLDRGFFHYTFKDRMCSSCNFRTICRRDGERLLYLNQPNSPYYIPEQNARTYKEIESIHKMMADINELAADKMEKKRLTITDKNREFIDACKKQFSQLSPVWQKRLLPSFEEAMHAWNGVLARVKP